MATPWIDISVPLNNRMHHWPGDPPPYVTTHVSTAKGDVCNVSAFFMSSHTGTHIDAPLHFLHGAKTMNDLPWDAVIGPARIIEIHDPESIKPAELEKWNLQRGERILIKTKNSAQSWAGAEFDKNFCYISKEGAQHMVDRGIQTVGIDYLSVGGFYKDGIETHHILLGAEVWIIEGLDLSQVGVGDYDLNCLPIRFDKGDGAPARCLIRPR